MFLRVNAIKNASVFSVVTAFHPIARVGIPLQRGVCVACANKPKYNAPRRRLLQTLAGAISLAPLRSHSEWQFTVESSVYGVKPPSTAPVSLVTLGRDEVLGDLVDADVVLLGEHHNSLVDHVLQAWLVSQLAKERNVAVGLEMVQAQFQNVLDAYMAGEVDELSLYLGTQWEDRWVWPFESYLPMLRACRASGVKLLALSIDSELLARARAPGGLANLSQAELRTAIFNPTLFAAMSKEPAFRVYVNECITPSYATHARVGLLESTANFSRFYTSRVLRDEAMAARCVQYMTRNPGTLLIGIMGADHVKFHYGVSGRVQRQLDSIADVVGARHCAIRTVLLNPTPADAYDPVDSSLKLEMGPQGQPTGIPISDYLWFSAQGDAQPRRKLKKRRLPPVEQLVLPEQVVDGR